MMMLLPPPQNTPVSPHNQFILPEYSRLSSEKRSALLFTQLLDMSKRDNYMRTWRCRYALNVLLSEFTAESLAANNLNSDKLPNNVKAIIEWIRVHYEESITVSSLAEHFNYHPTYMTSLLKKYTGHTVSYYITRYRITAAKNLLTANRRLSIEEVAYMCGFKDEKYFMRVFKKTEGMTPGQFRNAFCEKKLNLK